MLNQCFHCHKLTPVNEGTAVVRCYKLQPWFSYLEFICQQCHKTNKAFFGPFHYEEGLNRFAHTTKIGFVIVPFAPDHIVMEYEKVYDLHLLESKELTPRQEHEVDFFRWLLEQGVEA